MRGQYVMQEIGQGLKRNLTMVIAVIVSTAVALVMLGSGLLMWQQTKSMQDYWYGKVQVNVFLCNQDDVGSYLTCRTAVTQLQQNAIEAKIKSVPGVKDVQYESQQQAYARAKQMGSSSADALVNNITPNQLPSSFRISMVNPNVGASVIEDAVGGMAGVETVQDEDALLKPLFTFIHIAEYTAVGVAIVMLVLAFLLIFNTVRLSAFSRRRETGIMRLVGASNVYIQMPFLLEGAVAGLLGGVFAAVILVGVKALFIDRVVAPNMTSVQFIGWGPFVWILPVLLIVGVLMSMLASAFTLRKYLRV
jgi:cell division transport system permease protein